MHPVIPFLLSGLFLQGCSFSPLHCGTTTQPGFQMKIKNNFDPESPVSGKKIELKKTLFVEENEMKQFITSLGVVTYCDATF